MKKIFLTLVVIPVFLSMTSCGGEDGTFKVFGAATMDAATANETITYIGSPTFEEVTLNTIWLSTDPGCTGLVQVKDYGTSGKKFNMFDNPTLFEGSPADGVYNCMVIKLSDTMDFKPDVTDATETCVEGETYTYDIARGDDGETWVDENFNPITIDDSNNTVYIFATTDQAAPEANGVTPHQIISLTDPLEVPGNITLVLDFTNRVFIFDPITAPRCWLDTPTMAFK